MMSPHRLTPLLLLLAVIAVAAWIADVTPVIRSGADDFMPARLYHDLFVADGAWSDWHLPAAPYYFPDLALYFLILSTGVSFMSVSIIYAFVIAALTGLATWGIGTYIYGDRRTALTAALALVAALILAGEQTTFWNRPIFHYGVFFNALLVLVLLLAAASRRIAIIPLFALIVLAVMSDFLFMPIVTAAAAGYVAVMWLTGLAHLRDCILLAVAAAAVLLGYYLHFPVTPHVPGDPLWASGLHLEYGLFHPLTHWEGLRFAFAKLASPLYGIVGLLGVAAAVAVWPDRHGRSWFLVISAFFVFGILANLHVVGLDTNPGAEARYSVFATNGALAYGALCSGFVAGRSLRVRNGIPVAIAALAAAMLAAGDRSGPPDRIVKMLDIRDCLVRTADRAGLKYGLASYSNANRYSVLTDHRVALTQVRGDSLDHLPWQRSDAWLRLPASFVLAEQSVDPGIYEGERLAYPLSEEVVVRDAGEPHERHTCGDLAVMVYSAGALRRHSGIGGHGADRDNTPP